jgi:hypothetical protein
MKYRVAQSIARVVSAKPEHEDIHFHLNSEGRPFVCDTTRCESPGLSPREVGSIRS